MHAMLWRPDSNDPGVVLCDLCHHRCRIKPGKRGLCQARENQDGELETLVYGKAIALNADPIEKKPLYHFLPGTRSMSTATVGCNFRCDFCQNHNISQYLMEHRGDAVPGDDLTPEEVVRACQQAGCKSISYTYTEPTIFFEWAYDTAVLAHESGIANCFVSNGYMTPEAVEKIAGYLDAINVDLKAFDDETYRRVIGGELDRVLETIRALHDAGVWIELTTLLIEGMNDGEAEVRKLARFIADLDPDIPWHVSRFHPDYKRRDGALTSDGAVLGALEIAEAEGVRHVYCGNMADARRESTWCHHCGALLIRRSGFGIGEVQVGLDGKCPECGTLCGGVWGEPAGRG